MSRSLDDVSWPVRTERLVLRRMTPDDFPALWSYRRLPEVYEWLGASPTDEASFLKHAETLPDRNLVVELDRRIIGELMIAIEDGWAQGGMEHLAKNTQAELGWTFHPDAGGRGYATEAVRAAIDLCFGPLGLRRVHAGCFADNEASWRLMERVGMRREEFSRGTGLHRRGQWLDGMNYGLLADEWPRG